MPFAPRLDREALVRLRRLVQSLHREKRGAIPHDRIVRLARDVRLDAGLTIDFQAARDLGQPLVVLRVPGEHGPAECVARLSKRERQIVALIADGLSNKQIARRLYIALATVKDHVHRILAKTGLPNRAAVASAVQGHVPPPARQVSTGRS
jgi:ATP/maltotriose-dependent transcriptional regulator MalT